MSPRHAAPHIVAPGRCNRPPGLWALAAVGFTAAAVRVLCTTWLAGRNRPR